MTDAAAVARAYFEAIAARDADVITALFAPDAELVTMAGTVRGADAIAAFYRENAFAYDDLKPEPGPFVIDGNRVAVEIRLRMNGRVSLVADLFTIEGDRIRRLGVFLGPNVD